MFCMLKDFKENVNIIRIEMGILVFQKRKHRFEEALWLVQVHMARNSGTRIWA